MLGPGETPCGLWSSLDGASVTACSFGSGWREEVFLGEKRAASATAGVQMSSLCALRFLASFTPIPGGSGMQEPAPAGGVCGLGRAIGP